MARAVCMLRTASEVSVSPARTWSAAFFGPTTSIFAMTKVPPISGQSASTKHNIPRTGIAANVAWTASAARTSSTLLADAVDQLGAIAATDHECFCSWTQQPTLNPQVQAALIAFGVDHEYAARPDRDVVNVGARARDASIMQHQDALLAEPVQTVVTVNRLRDLGRPIRTVPRCLDQELLTLT